MKTYLITLAALPELEVSETEPNQGAVCALHYQGHWYLTLYNRDDKNEAAMCCSIINVCGHVPYRTTTSKSKQ
jgi:hypothetical protein